MSGADPYKLAKRATPAAVMLLSAIPLLVVSGCADDARLADHTIPHVVAKPVTEYGQELGAGADPKQVAYVLLRAIRDDVKAGKDAAARKEALEREFNVSDPDYIYALYREAMGRSAVYDRDEWLYKKVYLWAPTLAYYVESFDEEYESAQGRMVVGATNPKEKWPGETVEVRTPAADPTGNPAADVVVRILLHKHEGDLWRVFYVGFSKSRTLPRPTTQPTAPQDSDPNPSAAD